MPQPNFCFFSYHPYSVTCALAHLQPCQHLLFPALSPLQFPLSVHSSPSRLDFMVYYLNYFPANLSLSCHSNLSIIGPQFFLPPSLCYGSLQAEYFYLLYGFEIDISMWLVSDSGMAEMIMCQFWAKALRDFAYFWSSFILYEHHKEKWAG
jgi:hypothetical protein